MSAQHQEVICRQKAILNLLPPQGARNRGLTAQILLDRMATHFAGGRHDLRTIQRDLKALVEEHRAVIADPQVKPFRYQCADAELEETLDEFCWNYMVEHLDQYLATVPPERKLEAAIKRIQAPDDGLPLREDKLQIIPDTLRLIPAAFKSRVLAVILRALAEDKAVRAGYVTDDGKPAHSVIHPQAALQRGPRCYIFALNDDDRQTVLTYALDRFTSAEIMNQPAHKAADFDLDQTINSGRPDCGQGEMVRLVMLVNGDVAELLRECPIHDDQRLEEAPADSDFEARLTVTVPRTQQLLRWLIGWGADIKVMEPQTIASAIASQSVRVAALYHGLRAIPDFKRPPMQRYDMPSPGTVERDHVEPNAYHRARVA